MSARFAFAWVLLMPFVVTAADDAGSKAAVAALTSYTQSDFTTQAFAKVPLSKSDAAAAQALLWKSHAKNIKTTRAAEIEANLLKDDKLEMPIFRKTFGEKPKDGRSLWISLHGGGGAPARVNDGQWENQKKLYTVPEGVYIAPRAPTNTWNLWHEAHIDRLFARLIEDLVVLDDVNPDRVYVLGYSAGGDGVYQLAPRLADFWAAAAMMAGHPNDANPLPLRNVPFALQVGGKDSAYNRNKVAEEWAKKLDDLQKADPKGYEHYVKIYPEKGHWMDREDAIALPWMAKHSRQPVPEKVVWKTGSTAPNDRSYWLAVPPGTPAGVLVTATRAGNVIEITTDKPTTLLVRFDDRMVDLDAAITVRANGKEVFTGLAPRTIGTLAKTLTGRGDPKLMFAAEVAIETGSQ